LRHGFLLIPLALAWFALSQTAQGQDGDEGNHNTAEGAFALHTYITTASAAFNNTAIGFNTLSSNATGGNNTANGFDALFSNTTGSFNTATGYGALLSNTTADNNTANGYLALSSNTTGTFNVATGFQALFSNTTGNQNTATGAAALQNNTTGTGNTATGDGALFSNTTGAFNTANGFQVLESNTTGTFNTANGSQALISNTTGAQNTATGVQALYLNTIGDQNTAEGVNALASNTSGFANTASGFATLLSNTSGNDNTAVGGQALNSNTTGHDNTAEGLNALLHNTTGSLNIALGVSAGSNLTTGSNNIDIGAPGVAGESGKIRIGRSGTQNAAFIAGIFGKTVASGIGVIVASNGQLGTVVSSARFKEAIKPMDKASEAILALQPVTFLYKREIDPDGIPQFGLVAEQVEQVNPDLVARDADGKVNTVRYEAVNAMLLNEFLKEYRRGQEQAATIVRLKNEFDAKVAQQQKQIEALTAAVQKVSEQMHMSKSAPHLVINNK
jgi:hypothetical protein